MRKQKSRDKSILDNHRFTMLLSLALAILVWVIVTTLVRPGTSQTIDNVPINFEYDASKYTSLGLDIVNQPSGTVSLYLEGNGYDLGGLVASDFVVYPDYSAVRGAGKTDLKLRVRALDSQVETRVTATITGRQTTAEVVFDTVVEKSLPVTVETSGITTAEGYVLNRVTTAPAEVTVRGPESEVEAIGRVVAQVSIDEQLSDSRLVQVELQPVDREGVPVEMEYTTMDNTMVDATVSVYQLAELPLRVDFINVPSGFDTSTLNYTLSRESLIVAGPARQLAELTELSVASFDLASSFSMDKDFQLPVELPAGIVSQENITAVTLSFDTSNLAQKVLNIPAENVRVINLPSSYELRVESRRINNVVLIGPAEELENISASNVIARINAEDFQVEVGQENIPVQIVIPSSSSVFAVGSYTVQCAVTTR